ncbi:MAG: FG-GAP-like repeat-containing protein [Bacteroidales bacterium]
MNALRVVLLVPAFLCLLSLNQGIQAQCCNYQNSGQDIGTSPTFGVALGDLDGDGDQDVFTIDAYEDIEIYFNNGAGIFTLSQTIVPGGDDNSNYGVHLVDVDLDTDLDAVVVPFYSSSGLKIYKNNGAGNFFLFQNVGSNLASRYAGIADVDGDDDPDIILPGGSSSNNKVFKNNGTGFFTQFSSLTLTNFGQANDITVGDMDGDFDIDAVVVSSNAGGRLLLNDGQGNFTDAGISIGNIEDSYYTAKAGDMDKDGDLDLVFGGMYSPLTVIMNTGAGGFVVDSTYESSNYDKYMKLLDYDYDGNLDVFVSTYGSSGLEVWRNSGEAKLSLCYQNMPPMPGTYSHGFDVGLLDNDIYYDAFMGEFGGDGDKVFFGLPSFYIGYENATICYGEAYLFPDGSTGDTTMVHQSHFLSVLGCDSNIVTNLNATVVNTGVSVFQSTLTAQLPGAIYQWLDCNDNYAVIQGAGGQSYSPAASGTYAVEVTYDGCTDTSSCVSVVVTGIPGYDHQDIRISPNPVQDLLKITLDQPGNDMVIRIMDLSGRVVFTVTPGKDATTVLDLKGLKSGLYLLMIFDNQGHCLRSALNKI